MKKILYVRNGEPENCCHGSTVSHGPWDQAERQLVPESSQEYCSGAGPSLADSYMASLFSSPGVRYESIAEALRAASATGDELTIEAGQYEEAEGLVVTTNGLKVRGTGGPVLIRCSGAPVLTSSGTDVVLEDLQLEQAGGPHDCVVVSAGSLALQSVAMTSTMRSGCVVSGSSAKVSMQDCSIKGAGKYGCLLSDGAVGDARDSTIQECKAAGVVSRGKGSFLTAHGCTIQNNGGNGVGADEGGKASLTACSLLENKQCGL